MSFDCQTLAKIVSDFRPQTYNIVTTPVVLGSTPMKQYYGITTFRRIVTGIGIDTVTLVLTVPGLMGRMSVHVNRSNELCTI